MTDSERGDSIASLADLQDAVSSVEITNRRRDGKGCCHNFKMMCFNKKVKTQAELLQMHMADSAMTS